MGRVWTKKLDPHLPWDTGKGRSGVRRGCRKSFTIYASLGSSFLGRISTSLGPFWVIFVSICPALINYDRSSPPNGLRGAALVTFVKTRCGSGEVFVGYFVGPYVGGPDGGSHGPRWSAAVRVLSRPAPVGVRTESLVGIFMPPLSLPAANR